MWFTKPAEEKADSLNDAYLEDREVFANAKSSVESLITDPAISVTEAYGTETT